MRDPAFLFYSSDFLTGCTGLTMEERGQYITLMCLQHQHGHLSKKTIWLSLGYDKVFKNINDFEIKQEISEDVLAKFQIDENGNYYNERLEIEIVKRENFTDSRTRNGSKGGRPKKNNKPSEKPYGLPTENHTENENENIDINKSSSNTLNVKNENFEKVYPESNLVNEIIKDYNQKFKKSYAISSQKRMTIARICNEGNLTFEHWQIIFDNASRGWTIDGKKVLPTLERILEKWDAFLADDCNLNEDITKNEKEKEKSKAEKSKDLETQKQLEEIEKQKHLKRLAEICDKVSALTFIADTVPKLAWNVSSTVKEFRQKFNITSDEIISAYAQKETMVG